MCIAIWTSRPVAGFISIEAVDQDNHQLERGQQWWQNHWAIERDKERQFGSSSEGALAERRTEESLEWKSDKDS